MGTTSGVATGAGAAVSGAGTAGFGSAPCAKARPARARMGANRRFIASPKGKRVFNRKIKKKHKKKSFFNRHI
jgi:hypothetical protein